MQLIIGRNGVVVLYLHDIFFYGVSLSHHMILLRISVHVRAKQISWELSYGSRRYIHFVILISIYLHTIALCGHNYLSMFWFSSTLIAKGLPDAARYCCCFIFQKYLFMSWSLADPLRNMWLLYWGNAQMSHSPQAKTDDARVRIVSLIPCPMPEPMISDNTLHISLTMGSD